MQFNRISQLGRRCYARQQQQRVPTRKDEPDISSGCFGKRGRIARRYHISKFFRFRNYSCDYFLRDRAVLDEHEPSSLRKTFRGFAARSVTLRTTIGPLSIAATECSRTASCRPPVAPRCVSHDFRTRNGGASSRTTVLMPLRIIAPACCLAAGVPTLC